jgi:hypothetical protein
MACPDNNPLSASSAPAIEKARGRRRWWRIALAVLASCVVSAASSIGGWLLFHPVIPLEVGPETTCVTAPLDDEGYPDYVAVLNEETARGVSVENNAAASFWRIHGPNAIRGGIEEPDRGAFLAAMGLNGLPKEGDYFVSIASYVQSKIPKEDLEGVQDFHVLLGEQLQETLQRPWRKEECPELAAWLAVNERHFAAFRLATQCERFFSPLLGGARERSLMTARLFGLDEYLEMARIVQSRAMLALGEGRIEDAWQDLLALMRWARLIAQGPTLIDWITGERVQEQVIEGIRSLIQHESTSASQRERFCAELRRLGHLPDLADRIDRSERFAHIDMALSIRRHGPCESPGRRESLGNRFNRDVLNRTCDWNRVLREGNACYDRLVEAMRTPEPAARADAVAAALEEVEAFAETSAKGSTTAKMSSRLLLLMLPSVTSLVEKEDRAKAILEELTHQ